MKHLVCALIMAGITALELEGRYSCPNPTLNFEARDYNGRENQKLNRENIEEDFTITFRLARIDEPGTATGHWWNGKGLVDIKVRGL